LVADTLSLWAISRMIEIPWQMCGTDTLGVSPVRDATSPHHGKIPIPPIMDTQLDQIVIRLILNPLRAKVVQKFEQLITPAKRENWWEVYLSAFVMLNHIERLAMHSVAHAKTHTMAVSGPRVLPVIPSHAMLTELATEQVLQHPLPRRRVPHSQIHPRPIPLCLQRIGAIAARLDVARCHCHGQAGAGPSQVYAENAGYDRRERYFAPFPSFSLSPLCVVWRKLTELIDGREGCA
jgi:hypothetical protein